MRVALIRLACVAPLLLAALPAQAQDGPLTASDTIASGSYAKAERTLLRELRLHPDRPEVLLNLAAIYAMTGRSTEAKALYERVLAQDEVVMDLLSNRFAGSHAIARNGLRLIAAASVTAHN